MDTYIIIIFLLILLLIISNLIIGWLYLRQQRMFSELTKGLSKKDLKTILRQFSVSVNNMGVKVKTNQENIDTILEKNQSHFQKIGFMRFNPYSDTGGDQSFSLCLLDDHNSGVVITSLHSREHTRIYAKKIKLGKSDSQAFFDEEKSALKQAMN